MWGKSQFLLIAPAPARERNLLLGNFAIALLPFSGMIKIPPGFLLGDRADELTLLRRSVGF
jgi:hypothetical protein